MSNTTCYICFQGNWLLIPALSLEQERSLLTAWVVFSLKVIVRLTQKGALKTRNVLDCEPTGSLPPQVLTWAKQHQQRLEAALSELVANAELLEELLAWIQWAETTLIQRDQDPIPQNIDRVKALIAEHQVPQPRPVVTGFLCGSWSPFPLLCASMF